MEAAVTALPELDAVGDDAIAAPEIRQGDLPLGELALHLFHLFVQQGTGLDHLALGRGPGADLAAAGAGEEIGQGLPGRDALGAAVDLHLARQGHPGEEQGDLGVASDLPRLATLVVGEEDEAALVVELEQHGAQPGLAVLVHRRQAHAVGFGDTGGDGGLEPGLELAQGVGIQFLAGQALGHGAVAKDFGGGGHRLILGLRGSLSLFRPLDGWIMRDCQQDPASNAVRRDCHRQAVWACDGAGSLWRGTN